MTGDLVHQRYKFGKVLGQGSSATVYEGVHRRSKLEVAIKVIKKNGDMNDDESMATELDILKMVHHRYILNCHEVRVGSPRRPTPHEHILTRQQ